MLYERQPRGFNPSFETVACFLQRNGHFLLLLYQDGKPQSNRWGVPAGKVVDRERPVESMERELWEETGLDVMKKDISPFKTRFVRYPNGDFVFHMCGVRIYSNPIIILNPREHKGYQWSTPGYSLDLPLVRDMDACIEDYFSLRPRRAFGTAHAHNYR